MTKALKVGIIGASPNRGWARISHVPAVQSLDGLELHAVVTQDAASAQEAARQYGASVGYGDAGSLFADADVDVVTVAVNVPAHRDLVLGALAAGKHLLCEYPLGRDAAEAGQLAEAARKAGTHAVIGLQARTNPAVAAAKDALRNGRIGRLLSANVISTAMAFGPRVEAAMAFGEVAENGVTLPTIQAAHTLDLVTALLGEIALASTLASTQFPEVEVAGQGRQRRTVPDHLLVLGRVAGGAPVSIEVAGGRPPERTPFTLELVGDGGTLRLEGGAPRGFQSGTLRLLIDDVPQAVAPSFGCEPATAVNVAGLYASLRDDIRSGTHTAPDFDQAVGTQQLIEAVLAAAERR